MDGIQVPAPRSVRVERASGSPPCLTAGEQAVMPSQGLTNAHASRPAGAGLHVDWDEETGTTRDASGGRRGADVTSDGAT